jgi:hypothetical protein
MSSVVPKIDLSEDSLRMGEREASVSGPLAAASESSASSPLRRLWLLLRVLRRLPLHGVAGKGVL